MSFFATTSSAVGYSFLPRFQRRSTPQLTMVLRSDHKVSVDPITILTKLKHECATPAPLLQQVADAMCAQMRAGLAADGGSGLPMIPTYVHDLPTGNEKGLFYALDLGGTNFRVLRVQLGGKDERVIATEFEQVSIPQNLMFGTSEELFDFIALRLAKFAAKEDGRFHFSAGRKREIGFTFSFPVKQTSIDSGILIKWTKGFAVSGTTGKDVVACLNEAMKRQGLNMRVSALVNDTVGTLAGAEYYDNDVMVAVILGTGTNACYVEQINAIPKLQGYASSSGKMIISTEWGAFSNGLPLTEFDREMDAASINPGEQIFEKTISGMYLGEIVRRVLQKMVEMGGLFGKSVSQKLSIPFILGTPDICAMQQDNSGDLQAIGSLLYDKAGIESNLSERKTVLEVCDTIVKRGGNLAGAGVVGILQKMEENSEGLIFGNRIVVAIDGGLYENYPQYRAYLQDSVKELLGTEKSNSVVIDHTKDGSGIGAALLAASNSMYKHNF
ncbi:putative phosphotransferase with an alcohol group as acceptor [Lupinus albus]|uniref:Phosphotransferase n=1 Tax=Lupinus albus TaxID=3870 RepID=A0A6A4PF85_LUPAL|nr:putative phosphotransferase with an alcohol group as acceptor [Lupinus albus]